ncbi:hypothetical protein [Rhodanobacter hydrolyticus]|uniref:Uncharacterized protein n=1 Tax=Rhodanobacter hydrolyticus TaxID=2250595 RepID=A0ABW8JCI6_9GAMM
MRRACSPWCVIWRTAGRSPNEGHSTLPLRPLATLLVLGLFVGTVLTDTAPLARELTDTMAALHHAIGMPTAQSQH